MVPLVLSALLALAGCAAKPAVYDGSVAAHSIDKFKNAPKAVYANQIPVYPKSELSDAMGSQSWSDGADSYSEGMGWNFGVNDPTEKVVASYDQALPETERMVGDDGWTEWKLVPSGAENGEYVLVRVKGQEYWIHEEVKAGKRKAS